MATKYLIVYIIWIGRKKLQIVIVCLKSCSKWGKVQEFKITNLQTHLPNCSIPVILLMLSLRSSKNENWAIAWLLTATLFMFSKWSTVTEICSGHPGRRGWCVWLGCHSWSWVDSDNTNIVETLSKPGWFLLCYAPATNIGQ